MPEPIRFDSHLWTVIEDAGRSLTTAAQEKLPEGVKVLLQVFVKDKDHFFPCYFSLTSPNEFDSHVGKFVKSACDAEAVSKNTITGLHEEILHGIHGWGLSRPHSIDIKALESLPFELNVSVLCCAKSVATKEFEHLRKLSLVLKDALTGLYPLGAVLEIFHALVTVVNCENSDRRVFLSAAADADNIQALANENPLFRTAVIEKLCKVLSQNTLELKQGSAIWKLEALDHSKDEAAVAASFWVSPGVVVSIPTLQQVVDTLQQESQKLIPPLLAVFRALYLCRLDLSRLVDTGVSAYTQATYFDNNGWRGVSNMTARLREYSIASSLLLSILNAAASGTRRTNSTMARVALTLIALKYLEDLENGKIIAIPAYPDNTSKRIKSRTFRICAEAFKTSTAENLLGNDKKDSFLRHMAKPNKAWAPDFGKVFTTLSRDVKDILTLEKKAIYSEDPVEKQQYFFLIKKITPSVNIDDIDKILEYIFKNDKSSSPDVLYFHSINPTN